MIGTCISADFACTVVCTRMNLRHAWCIVDWIVWRISPMLQAGDLSGCAFDLSSDLWVVSTTQYLHICLLIILSFLCNILCIRLHQRLLCILLHKTNLVVMNDACTIPGTICASVMWFGSHGMSKLHVCVDVMLLPFGIVMLIGLSATCKFVTGAPSTRNGLWRQSLKWHTRLLDCHCLN